MISNLLNTPHICLSLIEIWKFFSKKRKKDESCLFFFFKGESFDSYNGGEGIWSLDVSVGNKRYQLVGLQGSW